MSTTAPTRTESEIHDWIDGYHRKHVPIRIKRQVERSRTRGSKKILITIADIDKLLHLATTEH